MIALARSDNIIPMPTKSNEWYTPARYVEAAREVMGGIDLDPASCREANLIIKATHYYTQSENGLMQPWYGRVFLNPPWCFDGTEGNGQRSRIGRWTNTLITQYVGGNVTEAILLAPAQIKGHWFYHLWEYHICFVDHIIHFRRPDGKKPMGPRDGNVFVYLGPHEQTFIDSFSRFGRIARAIDTPAPRPMPLSLWEGV